MSKIYAFVHSTDHISTYVFFPALGKFGQLENCGFYKGEILSFDKENKEIANPSKCKDIEISYGELIEITENSYKVKGNEGIVYCLPLQFFLPAEDLIATGEKVKLYKDSKGVVVFGEICKNVEINEPLEEAYPNTIGPKLPLSSMKNLFKFNKTIQTLIDSLTSQYSSWRKIRGDGNCYYRAIGLGLLEYFCRDSTPLNVFYNFLTSAHLHFQPVLKYLFQTKLKIGSAASYCANVFEDAKNDEMLVFEIRNRVAEYVEKNPEVFLDYLTDSLANELKRIREMGTEAEGIVCNYMSKILNVNIVSVILDREHLADYKDNINSDKDSIYLCLRGGHYDLLYTYQQDFEDNFGKIPINSQESPSVYIKSLHSHLKYLYEKIFFLSRNYDIRLGNYFEDFNSSLSDFWKNYGKVQIKCEEIQKSCDDLYMFISANNVICEVLGVCRYCESARAECRLACGDLFCREDAKVMISEQTSGNFVLPKDEYINIECYICKSPIGENDIRTILDKDYHKYYQACQSRILEKKQKLEAEQGITHCKNCLSHKHISKFPLSHPCLCESCFPLKISNNICPYCQYKFPLDTFKSLKYVCSQCESPLPPLPLINHSNHALCENCEPSCLDFNACIICQSQLTPVEEKVLNEKYYQSCYNCKSFFPSVLISIRKCGCLLCHNCMDQGLKFNSGNCLMCGEKLKILKKACEICMESFHRDEMTTLNCEHYFCCQCLLQYLNTQINSGLGIIGCPNCNEAIDGFIIQSMVPGKMWDAYNKASIRKKFQLADCPKCAAVFEATSKIVRCVNCQFKFCMLCKDPAHEGNCDDFKMKAVIKEIEKRGERVAQCPGCKAPYLKDEGCEHVACTNPSCGVEFCFTCSCLRSPTLAHGNHYHRNDCSFYAEYAGKDKESQDCTECKKLKKLCPRPKKLQVPRRFAMNET